MFAAEAKAFVQSLGDTQLISNDHLNSKMDLLTLVKVSEGSLWPVQKYKVMHCSLHELLDEEGFSPGVWSGNRGYCVGMKEGPHVRLELFRRRFMILKAVE